MPRAEGRKAKQLRPVKIKRRYMGQAAGSVLIECGQTAVMCTACAQEGVPKWRADSGQGWVTAEYDMLPGSTSSRRPRNRGRVDGRTQEIQRLIGRILRSVVDFEKLGENTILIDCDVLQADGGTRTASLTGAYVALYDAVRDLRKRKLIRENCITQSVAAVSVGVVGDRVLLDLDYSEDVNAEVDMNLAMTSGGQFIEIQGTAEKSSFTRRQLDTMLTYGAFGIRELIRQQDRALRISRR